MQCSVCGGDVVASDKEISCDFCKEFVHTTCSGLSRNEAACLKVKERKLTYYCVNCKDFKQQLASIKELKETVVELQNEVKLLKANAGQIPSEGQNQCQVFEQVITEIHDRQSRETNIIVFNLNESVKSTHKDRLADDIITIQSLFSEIPDVDFNKIQTFRLGKYVENKKRPVKVKLNCKEDVLKLLRNKKLIKTDDNVKISADQTLMQRNHFKSLKSELIRLNESGTSNNTIRYINGIPKIVKNAPKN